MSALTITIQLNNLAEALTVERALISRAKSLENLAQENFRRAPEHPDLADEYTRKAEELRHLADDIGHQAIQQAKRDTVASPPLDDSSYLDLISQPPEAS